MRANPSIMTWNRWRNWSLVAGSLACSACATPMTPQSTSPMSAVRSQSAAESSPAGAVRIGRPPLARNAIQPVAHEQWAQPSCPPDAITSCPPDARVPLAGPSPNRFGMPCDMGCDVAKVYPDEYLCDGGDRELPVHYGSDLRLGLDTEDTVAEFIDHTGKERTSKSNRVCVYSPRFASVRSVTLPYEEGTTDEVAGLDHAHISSQLRTRLSPSSGNKAESAGNMRMRSRASGVNNETVQSDVSHLTQPRMHDKIVNTFQDINFFVSGIADQTDIARLNLGIHAASLWSREDSPVIQAKVEKVEIGQAEISASVLTVIDDKLPTGPGQLRIVKVADKDVADVGDVITFTLRYDNLGAREVSAVRIVDNLTPRLEYVDDSATSDRAGRLVTQDNGEGSLILIWELSEPLPPKTGGVVTFQARVR